MHVTLEQLRALMKAKEAEHLEFKEAKERFDFEKLVRYCVALANEGGGRIVLGVTDKKPRQVVGTQAFSNMERTRAGLLERLHVRVETDVIDHPSGRVLVFTVPSRPIGTPIHYKGAYWMRSGEDLVPMSPDILKKIFDESQPDFSAEICEKATEKDLHPEAIKTFRNMWCRRSGNTALEHLTYRQLLSDAELMVRRRRDIRRIDSAGNKRGVGQTSCPGRSRI